MHNNQAHPNILFIMVDQHRFDYLNCAGAEFIKTPNLDRLAERGIRFENLLYQCPSMCSGTYSTGNRFASTSVWGTKQCHLSAAK